MSAQRPSGEVPGSGAAVAMRVLVVVDDARFAQTCTEVLRLAEPGCQVTAVPDLHRALNSLQRHDQWDMVMTELDLPDARNPLETVRTIVTAAHPAPVVVLSSDAERAFTGHAIDIGAQDVLAKDEVDARTVSRVVRHALDRSRLIAQVRDMCLNDPLTGLPNRRLWKDRCKVIFSAASRRQEQVAVLFIDIDRFKRINDLHGHIAGDMVLQSVGRTLAGVTRASDTAARISGDEFSVVAAVANRDEAHRLTMRVATALRSVGDAMSKDLRFTASIGVSVDEPVRSSPERVIDRAESAMKQAKTAGWGRVRWFGDPAAAAPAT